jgi:hypothetical protein
MNVGLRGMGMMKFLPQRTQSASTIQSQHHFGEGFMRGLLLAFLVAQSSYTLTS